MHEIPAVTVNHCAQGHRLQIAVAEYHTVAEEALNKDEIPGGYRFYVRRYFQLIRPRDNP